MATRICFICGEAENHTEKYATESDLWICESCKSMIRIILSDKFKIDFENEFKHNVSEKEVVD